ncbi:MAG: hypothetical protein PHI34_15285 [Acidobacteriota bacterium]|nr:hypothetical protein [Acidobacteriota bacterium]
MIQTAPILFLLAASLGPARPAGPPTDLRALVATELAFAKQTSERGIKDGFLAYLAEGSVVFRPGPVDARAVYAKLKPSPTLLVWHPAYAWISMSGDLGYTTGPWTVFKSRGEKAPSGWGHFVTLWKRQADGGFKAALDAGVSHAAPAGEEPVFAPAQAPSPAMAAQPNAAARAEEELRGVESRLAGESAAKGYPAGIGTYLGPDIRLYRAGEFPAVGLERAFELARKYDGRWRQKPDRLIASESGDLAYVYGLMERVPDGAQAAFLRIWRRAADGRWRLSLDLVDPLPAS